jgi:natural product biosynthesis luciferase-like monooxygenase protein
MDIDFSLFYFSSAETDSGQDKYRLLIEGARFADRHGFKAVWVPERHFHAFGGIYPNPSVLAAALAMVTRNVRLRSGSVVLPLHHPLRVVEEWSVVDNLSGGRVDLSFVRGWSPNDYVLAPGHFAGRTEVMHAGIETVKKLWAGQAVPFPNGLGKEVPTRVYPLPRQKDLAVWLTCTGDKERFIEAGKSGAHILTALLFQNLEELGEKIRLYRQARAAHGHDPGAGIVSLMLHTYVSGEAAQVRQTVRGPFTEYIKSSVDLWKHMIPNLDQMGENDKEQLFSYAFERYYKTSGLFGTPASCLPMVRQMEQIGINEVACLIDFGIGEDTVLDGLVHLDRLRELAAGSEAPAQEKAVPAPPAAVDLGSLSPGQKAALLKEMLRKQKAEA